MNIDEERLLKQLEARCQAYLDSNKATIEYSKMSLRGAFILNGAAVVAIVSSSAEHLYPSAILFAWGALAAVVATGLSYISQYTVMKTWQHDLYAKESSGYRNSVKDLTAIHKASIAAKVVSMAFIVVSSVLFAIGLHCASNVLQQKQSAARTVQIELILSSPQADSSLEIESVRIVRDQSVPAE